MSLGLRPQLSRKFPAEGMQPVPMGLLNHPNSLPPEMGERKGHPEGMAECRSRRLSLLVSCSHEVPLSSSVASVSLSPSDGLLILGSSSPGEV